MPGSTTNARNLLNRKSKTQFGLPQKQNIDFWSQRLPALNSIEFDWPDFWEKTRSPTVEVVVRVTNPDLPSYKQVQIIQDTINKKIGSRLEGLKFKVQVQRINITVVEGNEVEQPEDRGQATLMLTPQQTKQVLEQGPLDLDSDSEQVSDNNRPKTR